MTGRRLALVGVAVWVAVRVAAWHDARAAETIFHRALLESATRMQEDYSPGGAMHSLGLAYSARNRPKTPRSRVLAVCRDYWPAVAAIALLLALTALVALGG